MPCQTIVSWGIVATLVLFAAHSGCKCNDPRERLETVTLPDGTTDRCRVWEGYCGMRLADCEKGVNWRCVTNWKDTR